jgi:hypothetical protein
MAILFIPIVFAPYEIGSLDTSNLLSLYIPFDGNISSINSMVAGTINTSALRLNNTPSSVTYSGSLSDATLFYDGNYGTYSYVSQTSCSSQSSEITINYSRTVSDTGMILQKKDDVYNSNGGSSPNEGLMNITIPSDCFNYSSSQVTIKIILSASYYAHSTLYYYCLGNSGWSNILSVEASDGSSGGCGSSSTTSLYETSAYISNQSGYTAYSPVNISTVLFNTLNLTAGYAFAVYNSSQEINNLYNGVDTGIVYNRSGANFNGTGSYINTSYDPKMVNVSNFSIFVDLNAKCTASNCLIIDNFNESGTIAGMDILLTTADILSFRTRNSSGSQKSISSANSGVLNNNARIVATIDQNNISLYVNGQLKNTSARLPNDLYSNHTFRIGAGYAGGLDAPYNGSIKSVQLFNRTLSASEITELSQQYSSAVNLLGEANSAMNFTNYMLLTSNMTIPNSTSFWYKNSTGNWRHIVNVSNTYYCNAVSCSKPNDYPIYYTNGKINVSGFNGLLDELITYNYALSQSEIDTLYNGFNSSLGITIRDEITQTEILSPSIDIIADNFSVRQFSSTFFNGLPYGILTLRYSATNYPERFYYYNLSSYINDNLTLYSLDSNHSSNISFTLYDNTNDRVTDGYVRMLRYYIDDNSYKVVEMIKTNAYGEGLFHAEKDAEFYKFMVYKPFSQLVDTSIPDYIRDDSQYMQVNLVDVLGESFDKSQDIISSMTFNNATNNFRFEFSNNLAADSNITMMVYKLSDGDKTLINQSSTTSSAATILMPVTPENGTTYLADAYYITNGQTYKLSSNSTSYEYTNPMGYTGLILLFFLAIAAVFIAFYNIGIAIIFVSIINLVGVLIHLLPMSLMPVSIGIFVIGIFITILISRE